MKKSKLCMFLALLCTVMLLATACGSTPAPANPPAGGTPAPATPPADSGTPAATPPADDTVYTMKIGHAASPASTRNQTMLELAERVKEASGGRLVIEVFPASQLGDNTSMVQQVQTGTLEAVSTPTKFISGFHELFCVVDLPFLWPDADTTVAVLTSEVGVELMATSEPKGMKCLGLWSQALQATLTAFPVDSPASFQGRKFRTMPSQVAMDQYNEYGANSVPTDMGELYSSLQQNTLEGTSMTMTDMVDFKLHEVTEYLTMLDDSLCCEAFMVNPDWFNGLPGDLQTILSDEILGIAQWRTDLEKERIVERLSVVEANGNTITYLTPEQIQDFKDNSQNAYTEFFARNPEGQAFYDKIVAKIEELGR